MHADELLSYCCIQKMFWESCKQWEEWVEPWMTWSRTHAACKWTWKWIIIKSSLFLKQQIKLTIITK